MIDSTTKTISLEVKSLKALVAEVEATIPNLRDELGIALSGDDESVVLKCEASLHKNLTEIAEAMTRVRHHFLCNYMTVV